MSGYEKLENDPPSYGDRPQFVSAGGMAPTNPPPGNPYATHTPPPAPPGYGQDQQYGYGQDMQYAQPATGFRSSASYSSPGRHRPSTSGIRPPNYNANMAPESYTDTFEYKEATRIMHEGLFECFEDPMMTLVSWCFPCILSGINYEKSGQGPLLVGCCCHCLICGISRSHTQRLVGEYDPGCLMNCCLHFFCNCCALVQENRAIEHWSRAKANFGPLEM